MIDDPLVCQFKSNPPDVVATSNGLPGVATQSATLRHEGLHPVDFSWVNPLTLTSLNYLPVRGCKPPTRTAAVPSAANGHGHKVVTEMYTGQGLKRDAVDPRLTRVLHGTKRACNTPHELSTGTHAMKRCNTDKGHLKHTKQVESQKKD